MLCGWLSQDVPRWLFHTVGPVNSPLRRRVRPLQRAVVLVRVVFFPQTAGGARVRSRQHEHFSLLTPPLVLLYVLATVTSTARTAGARASRAGSSYEEGRRSRHSERISRACVRGRGSGVRAVYTGWVGVEYGRGAGGLPSHHSSPIQTMQCACFFRSDDQTPGMTHEEAPAADPDGGSLPNAVDVAPPMKASRR